MTYTYDQVVDASLEYFKGDSLAAEVFAGKYALRDPSGNIHEKTPEDMHRRLAKEFARIEKKYENPMGEDEVFDLLSSWSVIPQGSPMSAIGNPYQVQSLSNCFVIESPHDSYGGILKADQEQAQIMKRRGGVGFDVSNIRPKGLPTSNAARTTDGIGVFMERFSNTCREVAQGGRRGALMLSISCHHPEIRTFINIKRDLKKVTGANISIRLSDEFMNAVKDGTDVELRYPVDSKEPTMSEMVDARQLWHEIIENAHASAEPGLLFWDTVKRRTPAEAYASVGFDSTSTNPCGELILPPGDSCRLLLVNLTKFVSDAFSGQASFDYGRFEEVVYKAQKLMDDLVDLELEAVDKIIKKIEDDPEPAEVKAIELNLWRKIKKMAQDGRRTGLGITGLGDALAMCNVQYGSDESIVVTEKMYRSLALASYRSSVHMARDRGPFPAYSYGLERDNEFIKQVMVEDEKLRHAYEEYGRRNIANTTTAPAGSVSILAQTTSGCEPAFMLTYKRRRKINQADEKARVDFIDNMGDRWQMYDVFHHGFLQWLHVVGESLPDMSTDEGKVEFDKLVARSPYANSTSNCTPWVKKIEMQAMAQKWICHSISNTTNVPNETTVETVKEIYMKGWESGCKGVTIYRDGCRDGVLVSDVPKKALGLVPSRAPKRPKELPCDIHKVVVKGEQYTVIVGLFEGQPYELFCGSSEHVDIPKSKKNGTLVKNGKTGGVATYNLRIPVGDDEMTLKNIVELFDNPTYGAFSRSLSLALRHGVPVHYIVEQLRKDKHSDVTSFAAALARILSKNYIPDGTKAKVAEKKCQECGSTNLNYQQGCVTCMDCGSSKCG